MCRQPARQPARRSPGKWSHRTLTELCAVTPREREETPYSAASAVTGLLAFEAVKKSASSARAPSHPARFTTIGIASTKYDYYGSIVFIENPSPCVSMKEPAEREFGKFPVIFPVLRELGGRHVVLRDSKRWEFVDANNNAGSLIDPDGKPRAERISRA